MIHFERAPVSICLVLLEIVCSAWKFCFHARIQSVWSIEREREARSGAGFGGWVWMRNMSCRGWSKEIHGDWCKYPHEIRHVLTYGMEAHLLTR